ncbi:MAG: sigma 54-interacting transcriptional regulator [Polyangiaceae bacterium]
MSKALFAWLGMADIRAAESHGADGLGPIAQAVSWETFDLVQLISDWPEERTDAYAAWLEPSAPGFHVVRADLPSPTAFGPIYEAAVSAVADLLEEAPGTDLTFHLSPGTPAMAAVWVILGKTRFRARLIESSRQHGVSVASVPFDISARFLPDLLAEPDARLRAGALGTPPEAAQFGDIIYQCEAMSRVVERARRAAARSVPVLIEGESGTGKELLARAIHQASPRRGKLFVAVNCGAIPAELVESELFGHERGAFTGASSTRKGHFESASGGTLFLDELGELPLPAQVKLLRVLEEGEVMRIGASEPVRVDVRVIAATNRNLLEEAAENRFREDLFYRLAVAVLRLPPLRDRGADLPLLLERLWDQVDAESAEDPGYRHKMLSDSARSLLVAHPWPGNVRELLNTLRRVAIWSTADVVDEADMAEALLPTQSAQAQAVLGRPLGADLDINELLADVARHYLARAMEAAGGNKTKAAGLLGLASYQTLSNWLQKYGVEE